MQSKLQHKHRQHDRKILQAIVDGKIVQWSVARNIWNDLDFDGHPVLNFETINYRIKPGRPKLK